MTSWISISFEMMSISFVKWETVDQLSCFSYRDRERSRTRAHTHVHIHMRALHDAHEADASNAKEKGGSFTKRPNENAAPARVLVFFQSCPIIITPRMMRASPVASTNPVGRLLMELRLIVHTVHGSLTIFYRLIRGYTQSHTPARVVIVRQ